MGTLGLAVAAPEACFALVTLAKTPVRPTAPPDTGVCRFHERHAVRHRLTVHPTFVDLGVGKL
jgi:hypothetical protein